MDEHDTEDYHNFSTSPTHRLPTLTGTQALQDVLSKEKPISTNVIGIDRLLSAGTFPITEDTHYGIPLGTVTEVYGPPGAGKTTFALQLAANELKQGRPVTWIDAASSLLQSRLRDVVRHNALSKEDGATRPDAMVEHELEAFSQMHVTKLALLLALTAHPPDEFVSSETTLLVIDDLSNLVSATLPQKRGAGQLIKPDAKRLSKEDIINRDIAARRVNMISNIASSLQKLAASKRVAIVVTNTSSTFQQSGKRAVLRSSLNSPHWTSSIANRLVLYRNFAAQEENTATPDRSTKLKFRAKAVPARFIEAERIAGRDVRSRGIEFVIRKVRICNIIWHLANPLKHGIQSLQPENEETIYASTQAPRLEYDETLEQSLVVADEELDLGDETRPEDEDTASAVPFAVEVDTNHTYKRKAIEIADSDEEEDLSLPEASVKLPYMKSMKGGFLPSSQLSQDGQLPTTDVQTQVSANGHAPSGQISESAENDVRSIMLFDVLDGQEEQQERGQEEDRT